ncbi:hypothetical protein [Antrihabitans spumae]|uniref:Uncharacterized protein n=1 Tax=Antrihabitans spumae TaxID=3373370 RepID=A0ABW7K4X7_9NOCA
MAAAVPTEMANWWPKVERRFDGLAPEISVLVVPTQHGRVTALSFATDRSPYVVTTDGGSVTHETPWRVGNKTRTANRSQLLSLLVANTVVPDLELINPEISCIAATATVDNLKFEAGLFISAKERAMLPNHRWSVAISSEEWDAEGWGPLRPTLHVNRVGLDVEGPGVHVSDHSGLHVDGSGRVALRAELIAADNWSSEHRRTLSLQPSLRVVLEMPVDRQNRSARTTTTLRHRPSPTAAAFWREH